MANTPLITTVCAILLFALLPLEAQNAELSGLIRDPDNLAVPQAHVALNDAATGAQRDTFSDDQGLYRVSALPPGRYSVTVNAAGFQSLQQNDVILEVGQRARLDFALTIGRTEQSIIVETKAPLVNTSDASVSTVIGQQFVENVPLNGRNFSSLIDLSPGVVLTNSTFYEQGQFSVNGQRPDANYFLVDGVSANLGTAGGGGPLGQGGAGQLPATSAFGGTGNLVSLDTLEEFRIITSTFAPEYGRAPGAQVSVVTKSGTNAFHGTLFEYFRNDALDSNDWFANSDHLQKPRLRQNDFGGALGGPIVANKLFFFGSYEGLRVRQPHVAETYVPSLATRMDAPSALQPLLDAFPNPNGPDLDNGTASFSASYSDPSTLDSTSLRIDYLPSAKLTLFGRYSDAPSELDQRGGSSQNYSDIQITKFRTQTLTLGTNQELTPRWTNESRFNYSRSEGASSLALDNFGGAVPPPNSLIFPSFASPSNAAFFFLGDLTPNGLQFAVGKLGDNWQNQINVTENVSGSIGAHQTKIGLDYRRLSPTADAVPYEQEILFGSVPAILANTAAEAYDISRAPNVQLIFSNWSLFAQDTWNCTPSLTLTYGLRWEYNLAPVGANGNPLYTVTGLQNPATMTLAPASTPLWIPQKDDLAPRLGMAYHPYRDLVLRAGAGIFYDTGYSSIANLASGFPYVQQRILFNVSLPLSAANAAPVPLTTTPPVPALVVVDPNHALPRVYEWNSTVEQSVWSSGVITLAYVGSAGRKLMSMLSFLAPNPNFTGEVDIASNDASSSYNALQAQFRQRLTHGLQMLLSYTWGHSIDNSSGDSAPVYVLPGTSALSLDRGSSDFDIRHTFSGAFSYDVPEPRSGAWRTILKDWSLDSRIYARSALPVNIITGQGPLGANSSLRPDLVPGMPLYIYDSNAPGGMMINPEAFSIPQTLRQGTLGRNSLRGFGATQIDLSLRRQFAVTGRLRLEWRTEFFNLLNHPNFGSPVSNLSSPLFGQATQMLAGSLGSGGQNGGLSPLYQIGGSRSVQLALRLQF